MKKRFLPFSLLLVIMILGQSLMADQGGHYVPRVKGSSSVEAYLSSMRVNQHTGMIDPAWLIAAAKQSERSAKGNEIYWLSMGPNNMGGRTTSVVFNNANPNEVYIGSMGGGVYLTYNMGVSWHKIGDNLMVSCMTQAADGTIYVGTGDGGAAYDYNGMSDLNYGNSFVGTGLYTIKNNVMTLVPGTSPTTNNDPEGEWSYINDIAMRGDVVVAATSDGVRYLKDGAWHYAQHRGENLTGSAIQVKVGNDPQQTVVASVDGKIYVGSLENMICKSSPNMVDIVGPNGIDSIATAPSLLDIAVAMDDNHSMIYAATINNNGKHNAFYLSEDKGESWRIILPEVNEEFGHQVYDGPDKEGFGLYNHGLVVDPWNPDHLYVTARNLWYLERPVSDPDGYYMALQLSSSASLHEGVNAFVFDPRPEKNLVYVGTEGGIYQANKVDNTYFAYVNCNRGYISTRCLGVAPSGEISRVVGGLLDHGPVLVKGDDALNNMETGEHLLPVLSGGHFQTINDPLGEPYEFDNDYNAGSCAVSLIQPEAIIVTAFDVSSDKSGARLGRTEDGGANYDFANFTTDDTFDPDFSGYYMPIAYWESFHDNNSADSVWFKCKKDLHVNEWVQCISHNGDYPFNYQLPIEMHYNATNPNHSDSLLVQDPVSTKLIVPSLKSGSSYYIYYTLDAIQFSKLADWYRIATITGYPTCMAFSADGDNVFIGTLDNGLYRISNLRHAVDASTAHPDSANFAPRVSEIALPITDQCITSIAVFTDDPNKIVVTLGNYGNNNYVLYSKNALAVNPTFMGKQGNLPKMPVFSSVFTSTYDGGTQGHVLIGTDHGIYRTTDITATSPVWTLESENMGDIPVMEMKQQLIHQETQYVTTLIDSVPTVTTFMGTNNQGVIYAATYGRGLFRCETYRQHSGADVPETPSVTTQQSKLNMYPNPVRDEAKVCFELNDNAMVSYQVYDMSGRLVKMESVGNYTEGKHELNVNMSDLAKGAYVLRLNAGSRTLSAKFMVF